VQRTGGFTHLMNCAKSPRVLIYPQSSDAQNS